MSGGDNAVARQKQPKFKLKQAAAGNGKRRTKRRQTRISGKQPSTTTRIADLIKWSNE
jgi:hypothetical protein